MASNSRLIDEQRATDFRQRIKAAGMTLAEFSRRSGITRNIVYRLTKGQKPKPSDQNKIAMVFEKLEMRE